MTDNPFKRLRRRRGLSQSTLSGMVGCSKQLIIRTEQGCFTSPPPILLNYFSYNYSLTTVELEEEYEEFQRQTRRNSYRFLGNLPDIHFSPRLHPFTVWRTTSNRPGFNLTTVSKKLCISQSTLYRFEHKPALQQSVPSALLTALSEAGYSDTELLDLEDMYAHYRQSLSLVKVTT